MQTIDIIGGGIGGLATAFYLHRQTKGIRIRLWEQDDQWGGLAGMFEGRGFKIEKFHHHLYQRDTDLQQLIEDVGLPPVEWKSASTGLYYYQQAYQLSSLWQLLRFRPLSFWDRIKLAFFNRRTRSISQWQELDGMTAKDYIVQHAGNAIFETIWRPLLEGKFGKHADTVSAAWLWCKAVERPQTSLGYLPGGLGKIFDRIVQELSLADHEFTLQNGIRSLSLNEQGRIAQLHTTDGQTLEAQWVVAAVPPPVLAQLLPDSTYNRQLAAIPFLANVCLVMVIDRSLSDFYCARIMDGKVPFAGLVEHTQWTGTDLYNGNHLAYISSYIPQEDKRLSMSTDTLFDMYLPHIQRIFPDFNKAMVKSTHSWTARYAQPIVEKDYRHKIPAVQTPIPNLLTVNMAQIYPSDRQLSGGVAKAKEAAQHLAKML